MKTLKPGDSAPNFCLTDQAGEEICLADFQGKERVLVYFYPKASTPGWTTQAQGLRDNLDTFDSMGIAILGISPDPVKRLEKFSKKQLLAFSLLSDEQHEIAERFGVWGEKKFMGKVYDGIHRISFLVGKDGKIEQVFNKFKTADHAKTVLEYIKNHA